MLSVQGFWARKSMESMAPGAAWAHGIHGPPGGRAWDPGPSLLAADLRKKHVLGKSNISHAEKWCLMSSFAGIRDQGVNKQAYSHFLLINPPYPQAF